MSSKVISRVSTKDRDAPQKIQREIPFAIGSPALVWQVLFFYLPLSIMLISSICFYSTTGSFSGLTTAHFSAILKPTFFLIIINSIGISSLTAMACLLISFPIAYFLVFRAKRYKTLFLFLLIIPFWTNFLLHIQAWFFVLEKEGFFNQLFMSIGLIDKPIHFLNSYFATFLMMVYYYLPFTVLPIYSSLERFDQSLIEVSYDLGANWRQTICKILLPSTLSGIRAGFFLVYIPAFGEFVIPEMMGGGKLYFAGNAISQLVLNEKTISIGIAFTTISAFVLLISAYIFNLLINKGKKVLMGERI